LWAGYEYAGKHQPIVDGPCEPITLKNERQTMHLLLLSPAFASVIWIGGGSIGLVILIVVVVLLLR
jgi:hypothetical protein